MSALLKLWVVVAAGLGMAQQASLAAAADLPKYLETLLCGLPRWIHEKRRAEFGGTEI